MALEPHAGRLKRLTPGQQIPSKDSAAAVRIDVAMCAVLVPESTAIEYGTVALVITAGPGIVVAVERRKHHPIMVAERIAAGVTRVPSHLQRIVVHLAHHSERAVLDIVPATTSTLKVEPQLVAAVQRQLAEQLVTEPVVTVCVVEADFELGPRTIEEVGPFDVLLHQQRDAVFYTSWQVSIISKKRSNT